MLLSKEAPTDLCSIANDPIVASELAGIPLQPPTVVGTCPAHAFHPDATLNLAGQDRRPPGAGDA